MKKYITLLMLLIAMKAVANGKWTIYKIEDSSSPKNDITAVCFDKQGSMWVATSYGIYKYIDGKWLAQGPENIYVHSLFIDNNDTKWAGLYGGGVFRNTDGVHWKNIPEATKSQSVNIITADQNGSIWVGDWNEGIFNLIRTADEKDQWISYRADNEKTGDNKKIGNNSILSIAPDSKNRIWIGSYRGVSMFENNKWTFFNKQNSKLPDNDIYSLATDKKENIWVGTGNGLVKISGTEWTVYNNENSGLSCDLVLSLATDVKGNIWAGTNKGIFFFDGKNWINYTVDNCALTNNRIQTITVHNNKVYFGTSSGLSVYE
jgi:ligand-binding sensor domain-containing protein